MDLQEYVLNKVATDRRERLDKSDQLTLGELLAKLEAIAPSLQDKSPEVIFDFCNYFPTGFDSWRGSYDELALEPSEAWWGYEGDPMSLDSFIKMCRETIGKEFTGYKGGEFTMGKTTPVWVASHGNSGNTALVDVIHDGYSVILVTGFREF